MSFQLKQAIASGCAALVAIAALWGLDLKLLNEPAVQGLIIAAAGALASFIPKKPAPTLTEAYHVVESANQARERQRFADDQPGGLRADDGHLRPDNQ